MPSFIISGSTSMIGIALCHQILEKGDNTVYALCREGSNGVEKLPKNKNLIIIYVDFEHIKTLKDKIISADIFINLAWANTDHTGRNNPLLQNLNVEYATKAMEVAVSVGCQVFVQAGSQAEYGYINDYITEDTPCNPEIEYGKAKLKVLEKGKQFYEDYGLKYIHLRIFSVFGENDRPWTLIMSAMDKMLRNESLELSFGTQNWNYLYVDDCAKQIFLLCNYVFNERSFNHEIYHIASRTTRPLREYIEEMKLVLLSSSVLEFGKIIPVKQVSLNPSIQKMEKAIGILDELSFIDAIRLIANKNYKKEL